MEDYGYGLIPEMQIAERNLRLERESSYKNCLRAARQHFLSKIDRFIRDGSERLVYSLGSRIAVNQGEKRANSYKDALKAARQYFLLCQMTGFIPSNGLQKLIYGTGSRIAIRVWDNRKP